MWFLSLAFFSIMTNGLWMLVTVWFGEAAIKLDESDRHLIIDARKVLQVLLSLMGLVFRKGGANRLILHMTYTLPIIYRVFRGYLFQ